MFGDASHKKAATVTSAGQRSETTQDEAPPKTKITDVFGGASMSDLLDVKVKTPESSLLKAAARLNTEEMTPAHLFEGPASDHQTESEADSPL